MSETCAEGIFVTFPWWLKNVKSRSKIAPFSNERHFEIWFPKKKTITFLWSKLSKLHKKRLNFACGNYIFPKTRGNKNKPWTHSTPLKLKTKTFVWIYLNNFDISIIKMNVNWHTITLILWRKLLWNSKKKSHTNFVHDLYIEFCFTMLIGKEKKNNLKPHVLIKFGLWYGVVLFN